MWTHVFSTSSIKANFFLATMLGFGVCFVMHQMVRVLNARFKVEKLNGRNKFEFWKLKMHDLLVQQGLHKTLVGKSNKLVNMIDEDWEDVDTRALSTILLCLENDVLFNIVREETTTGLWRRMESLYMTKFSTNQIYFKRQLYNLRMKEGTKIVDNLNIFNTLMCQLTSMGVKIKDEDKAATLLCSLLEFWEHLISFSTIYTLGFDYVFGDLLFEEVHRKSNIEL